MDKICGICGEDCSNRPRLKDGNGRYFCKTCAAARVAQRTAAAPEPPPVDDSDPYDLNEPDPGAAPLPIEMLDHAVHGSPCPACMHTMPADAKVCVSCGYNIEKGIQTSTHVEKRKTKGGRKYTCRECGYDLAGLRSGICPECGTRIRLSKTEKDEQIERDTIREEYRKPAIWLAVAAAGICLGQLITGDAWGIVLWGIGFAIELPLMLIALWICDRVWLGQLGNLPLNALRLAGAAAVADLAGMIAGSLLFGPAAWLVGVIFFIGMLMELFDLELQDGFFVFLIMVAVKILAAIFVVTLVMQAMGLAGA